jgi:hypothetical protein
MRHLGLTLGLFAVTTTLSCQDKQLPKPGPLPTTYFTAQTMDTRFNVADHFQASIEMQISGEPFSQLLGRNLTGFDRFNRVTDLYTDPATGETITDVLGYATAVESYEYSKQPMNNTSFESGAGLSLQFGPLVNPTGVEGDPAYQLLVNRLQHLGDQAFATGPAGKNFVASPPPSANPLNVYGWPGFWPVFAEFQSFRPDIQPSAGATRGCTFTGGYAATAMGAQVVGDYECGYNSLNLPVRDLQVTKVIDPAALGFATWKQGLWVINYWQSLHDLAGNSIIAVADADLPNVGQLGNTVIGQYADPTDPTGKKLLSGMPGVYLGDITLEGWQGLVMLEEMHNKATLLLGQLLSTDGASLGGFASTKEAIGYSYTSPLRFWPAEIAVTEDGSPPPAGNAWKYFPKPIQLTVQTGTSRLRGLSALMGGFAEYFALTDFDNPDVGGQPSSRATFDGDPFPADDLLPDGEDTPHDRALAVMKVAVVDADRLHFDPQHGVLVDESTIVGGTIQRGTTVTTLTAAYAIVALRTALRSMAGTLTLYSNDTPDTHGVPTALDGAPLDGAPAALPDRILQLITAQADFLADELVDANGAVANGYDVGTGTRDPSPTTIGAEAAAIRGLLDAYLATSVERYREVAMRVYEDLILRFWMDDVRAFRTTAGISDVMTWTPLQYGPLSGALRQYWKLVARRAGQEQEAAELLARWKRTFTLVVNGWDDANADDHVQYPDECTGAGLEMGERALTGELSHSSDGPDRDHDCVKEIGAVQLPAALAAQIVINRK